MKKYLSLFGLMLFSIVLSSCEGSDGPQGPPGPSILPIVVEYEGVNFDTSMGRKESDVFFKHPREVDLALGDVVFVFFLDDVDKNGPIWTPVPISYYKSLVVGNSMREIEIEYLYKFSPTHVSIKAQSADDLFLFKGDKNNLSFTDNLTFRVVYIEGRDPIQGRSAASLKSNADKQVSYDELVEKYNIKESNVKRIAL